MQIIDVYVRSDGIIVKSDRFEKRFPLKYQNYPGRFELTRSGQIYDTLSRLSLLPTSQLSRGEWLAILKPTNAGSNEPGTTFRELTQMGYMERSGKKGPSARYGFKPGVAFRRVEEKELFLASPLSDQGSEQNLDQEVKSQLRTYSFSSGVSYQKMVELLQELEIENA